MKDISAKVIRVITVPPVIIAGLLALLGFTTNIFQTALQAVVAFLTLGLFPILAYPMQKIVPLLKDKGREGQRKLAFVFSIIGYSLAVVYGYVSDVEKGLQLIFNTYFFSVILLAIMNVFFHVKASGHACSITGPLVFSIYFLGLVVVVPCIIIACGVVWSSLKLKRHSKRDLLTGSLCALAAFGLGLLVSLI